MLRSVSYVTPSVSNAFKSQLIALNAHPLLLTRLFSMVQHASWSVLITFMKMQPIMSVHLALITQVVQIVILLAQKYATTVMLQLIGLTLNAILTALLDILMMAQIVLLVILIAKNALVILVHVLSVTKDTICLIQSV